MEKGLNGAPFVYLCITIMVISLSCCMSPVCFLMASSMLSIKGFAVGCIFMLCRAAPRILFSP